ELAEDRRDDGLAATGLLLGQLHQPVPSGRLQRPERLPAVLGRLPAQVDVHDALAGPRSIDRARRIRCTSMLPEPTVDASEQRQWHPTSARNRPARRPLSGACAAIPISPPALS